MRPRPMAVGFGGLGAMSQPELDPPSPAGGPLGFSVDGIWQESLAAPVDVRHCAEMIAHVPVPPSPLLPQVEPMLEKVQVPSGTVTMVGQTSHL